MYILYHYNIYCQYYLLNITPFLDNSLWISNIYLDKSSAYLLGIFSNLHLYENLYSSFAFNFSLCIIMPIATINNFSLFINILIYCPSSISSLLKNLIPPLLISAVLPYDNKISAFFKVSSLVSSTTSKSKSSPISNLKLALLWNFSFSSNNSIFIRGILSLKS